LPGAGPLTFGDPIQLPLAVVHVFEGSLSRRASCRSHVIGDSTNTFLWRCWGDSLLSWSVLNRFQRCVRRFGGIKFSGWFTAAVVTARRRRRDEPAVGRCSTWTRTKSRPGLSASRHRLGSTCGVGWRVRSEPHEPPTAVAHAPSVTRAERHRALVPSDPYQPTKLTHVAL
jgi:hypothetical protein